MVKLFILASVFSITAKAYDCTSVKPFKPSTSQEAIVYVSRIYWDNNHNQQFEDVCNQKISVNSYDVRGREEEAFYCLNPQAKETLDCKTKLDGDNGKITIVPATWIRNWNPKAVREYRFHAYATKNKDNTYLKDIFSRSLSTNLKIQEIIVEGALKTGAKNPDDGYFVRVQFKN